METDCQVLTLDASTSWWEALSFVPLGTFENSSAIYCRDELSGKIWPIKNSTSFLTELREIIDENVDNVLVYMFCRDYRKEQ